MQRSYFELWLICKEHCEKNLMEKVISLEAKCHRLKAQKGLKRRVLEDIEHAFNEENFEKNIKER